MKLLAFALSLSLAVCLSSCGNKHEKKARKNNINNSAVATTSSATVETLPKKLKPAQKRDLEKYPLAGMYYQYLLKEAGKTRSRLVIETDQIASNYEGTKAIIPPLKGFDRTKEKVDTDYKGDWKKSTDIVRGSLVFQNMDDLQAGLKEFNEHFPIVYVKDRFLQPTERGYRDVNTLFIDPENRIIGEMQFHLCQTYALGKKSHEVYETIRTIQAEAAKQQRELTKEEQEAIKIAEKKSKSEYDKAYQRALRKEVCPK